MTTGSLLQDNRVSLGPPYNSMAGTYFSKTWSGGNDPNKRIPQAYSMTLTSYLASPGIMNYCTWPLPSGCGAWSGDYPQSAKDCLGGCTYTAPDDATWTSNDELILLNKLVTAVRSHDFNAGIFLGEGRETFRTIAQRVGSFHAAFRALHQGRLQDAIRAVGGNRNHHPSVRQALKSGDISSLWLEVQYGWKPMLSDLYEAQKAFRAHVTAARSHKFVVSRRIRQPMIPALAYVTGSGSWSRTEAIRLRMYPDEATFLDLLGLDDPLSVLWEVTPFSFVADWFVPIGSYLSALHTIPSFKGTFVRSSKTVTQFTNTGFAGGYTKWTGGPYVYRNVVFNRTIPTSLSVPLPSYKGLDKAFSLGHTLNAIALIHQLGHSLMDSPSNLRRWSVIGR